MSKIDPFEQFTSQYEDWFEKYPLVYESELRAIKKVIPYNKKGLEIGVGTGRFAKPLNIQIGIDPSKEMRKIAKQRSINTIGAVAENLPFKDKIFDFSLIVTTICFLDDIDVAIKEAYRVLKSKGNIIIGFVDKNSLLGKLYQKQKNKSVFYTKALFYSVEDVTFYLRKTGFFNIKFSQTIFHNLGNINDIEPSKKGYGDGSFVVIKASKKKVTKIH